MSWIQKYVVRMGVVQWLTAVQVRGLSFESIYIPFRKSYYTRRVVSIHCALCLFPIAGGALRWI